MAKRLRKVVGVRLSIRDARELGEAAELRGLRVSQLIRQLILEWLNSHGYLDRRRRKAFSREARG